MNPFVRFMVTPTGQIARAAVGAAVVAVGLGRLGGVEGTAMAALGAVPLVAGIFNVCLIGPLFHLSCDGSKIRPQ
jgi:hypothetical protein